MELFTSLGLNETVFYQFGVFFVAFLIINNLIFKPYFKALEERKKRTLGNVDQAGSILEEAQKLEEEYGEKARGINEQIKSIYEASRRETAQKQNAVTVEAQQKTKIYLDTTKQQLEEQIDKARAQIKPYVSDVAESISSQMLGN